MRTLKDYISEAMTDFCLNYVSNGQNNQQLFKSIDDCKSFLKKTKNVTYYDITKGSNSSEVENLIEWAGERGYWANKLENASKNSEKEKIERKRCSECI